MFFNKIKADISINEDKISYYKPFVCTVNLKCKSASDFSDDLILYLFLNNGNKNLSSPTKAFGTVLEITITKDYCIKHFKNGVCTFNVDMAIPSYEEYLEYYSEMKFYEGNYPAMTREVYTGGTDFTLGIGEKSKFKRIMPKTLKRKHVYCKEHTNELLNTVLALQILRILN